jgi:NAD(P)-dependent dehydrogenase (short-subunit alcohol dehydrogenase family)
MDYPRFDLDGQVALVTGASRGIGHDLAEAIANAGAEVIAGARTKAEFEHERIHQVELDVRDRDSVEAAVAEATERFGKLDVLVNNAGLGTNHDALDATEDEWDELMAVNLKGAFLTAQAAGRRMVERGYGRIVNMSSQAAAVGIRRHAAYSASKAGLEGLTRVLALEWAPHGVTVNAVAPTFIRTPGTAERLDEPEFLEDVLTRIPLGRVGSTTEVAAAVIFLASPSASLITGAVLPVDGGWTAQ